MFFKGPISIGSVVSTIDAIRPNGLITAAVANNNPYFVKSQYYQLYRAESFSSARSNLDGSLRYNQRQVTNPSNRLGARCCSDNCHPDILC